MDITSFNKKVFAYHLNWCHISLKGQRSEKNVESPIEQMWYYLRVLAEILILSFGNELIFII